MLEFRNLLKCFGLQSSKGSPGVPPDPQKYENVLLFSPKTNVFQTKKAGISSCFFMIFEKKTDDTVQKTHTSKITSRAEKASTPSCFFIYFW